ncbi:MAG TPA: aconitate hydratase [Rhabdochlamydiaceae bacterium]|nr:aconitate hydratase [Rhabdochlamydiaceae bacterium]
MATLPNPFNTLKTLNKDETRYYYSLPALEEQGIAKLRRLPVSIRIMLESLLRNCDGKRVKEEDVLTLAKWNAANPGEADVPFVVSRVILQDFTGVPLLVDLAAMRDAVAGQGADAKIIEPQVPVDLVVDHSVQVDKAETDDAFMFNLKIEFDRNRERYEFLKWGQGAFDAFKVVPPGIGIVHQVNLENIASVVTSKKENNQTVFYPDTLVGTDSHTTMINGLGVVGWGVGGIEAEAAMLGQPVAMQTPEVIGFCLHGALQEGMTATDLTLRITEILRKEKVVGKFVEFFGEGAASLTVADRATIGNMSPEYGATMGFFPVDEKTLDYLKMTGRDEKHIALIKEYLQAQQLFGIPRKGEIDYTKVVELDLTTVTSCVSGPKRPQDRIDLPAIKSKFHELLSVPIPEGGYGKASEKEAPKIFVHSDGTFTLGTPHSNGGIPYIDNDTSSEKWSESEMVTNRPLTCPVVNPGYSEHYPGSAVLTHGSIVIAAITSCTNTSNPHVMIGAGLLAKKAVEKGLKVNHTVKTSLAPGSRVVTDYLEKTGLQKYLNELGFQLVAYGCTTCIGNSGPLDEKIEKAIKEHDLVAASVLSGNRNFEARIHSSVKANFLMSPPLVVAFAIAGRVDINLNEEPLGMDRNGKPVYLKDIWPSSHEIQEAISKGLQPEMFKKRYANILEDNPVWKQISTKKSLQYAWDKKSTYIQQPPYFEDFSLKIPEKKEFKEMRALALFGDSVTTDHISPAGAFRGTSPAGKYLLSLGVPENEFNSYGSRRGNHFVMMRGTFANVRIYNKMAGGKEGGFTKLLPDGEIMPIFDACQMYAERKVPLIIFAGKDYGMGSSRDWAAKGTALLGIRTVVARSFERIHRSNLIGMGVLPLEFLNNESADSLKLTGDEIFSISGLEQGIKPRQEVTLEIKRGDKVDRAKLLVRIDTPTEAEYFQHGGILPFVLRTLIASKKK